MDQHVMKNRQLLQEYVSSGNENAFAELVSNLLPLVYSTAHRLTHGDHALSQDISQQVFTDLARKARLLSSHKSLAGWLYRHTCFTSQKVLRSKRRQRRREERAAEILHDTLAMNNGPDNDTWTRLSPWIDEAMGSLSQSDREAVLLRFFHEHDYESLGKALGVNPGAAQRRVSRAVERLRQWLEKRGVVMTVAVLATALERNAVAAVPSDLCHIIAANALKNANIVSGTMTALSVTAHVKSATLGASLVFALGSGGMWLSKDSNPITEPPANVSERSVRNDNVNVRQEAAQDEPLHITLERLRALARAPDTAAADAALAEALSSLTEGQLVEVAKQLSGPDNERAVWFRALPAVLNLWARFDTTAAMDFCASSAPGWPEYFHWRRALRQWDGAQLDEAKDWFRKVASSISKTGEGDGPAWYRGHGLAETGAILALKDPAGFEAFLESLPELSVLAQNRTDIMATLRETVRGYALAMVGSLPLEEQRVWAETLSDPEESGRIISSIFHTALRKRKDMEEWEKPPMAALGEWARDHVPEEDRPTRMRFFLEAWSKENAREAITWLQEREPASLTDQYAQEYVRWSDPNQPELKMIWAESISDPSLRELTIAGVFRHWCRLFGRESKTADPRVFLDEQANTWPAERIARLHVILSKP